MSNEKHNTADLGQLILPATSLAVQLSINLREVPEGGDFEALPDPFVQLKMADGSRYYTGTLCLGHGFYRRTVLLKFVMANDSNQQALVAKYRQFVAQSDDFASLIEVTEQQPYQVNAPIFICKRKKVLFHPLCGICGTQLLDYQDSNTAQMPRHHRRENLLHCPDCSKNQQIPTQYSNSGITESIFEYIKSRLDLIANFERLLTKPESSPDSASPLTHSLPCRDCEHTATCYPIANKQTGDAVKLIVPLSFNQFSCLIIEYLPLRLDEYAMIAGGRSLGGVLANLARRRDFDRKQLIQQSLSSITLDKQQISPAIGSASIALRLKLSAFRRVCYLLSVAHQQLKTPFGEGLAQAIMVHIAEPPVDDYALANCEIKLKISDLTKVTETDNRSVQRDKKRLTGQLSVTSVEEDTINEMPGVYVCVELSADSLMHHDLAAEEVFIIHFGLSEGFTPELDLAFVYQQKNGDYLLLRSADAIQDNNVIMQFRTLRHLPFIDVTLVVKQVPGIEKDLEQLGYLFFQILLQNEQHNGASVHAACHHLLALLENQESPLTAADSMDNAIAQFVSDQLSELTRANPSNNEVFLSTNVLYHGASASATLVPPTVWLATLAIGLQMICKRQSLNYLRYAQSSETRWQVLNYVTQALDDVLMSLQSSEQSETIDASLQTDADAENDAIDEDVYSILSGLIKDNQWLDRVFNMTQDAVLPSISEPVPGLFKSSGVLPSVGSSEDTAIMDASTLANHLQIATGDPASDETLAAPEFSSTIFAAKENLEETVIISKESLGEATNLLNNDDGTMIQGMVEAYQPDKPSDDLSGDSTDYLALSTTIEDKDMNSDETVIISAPKRPSVDS